MPLSSFSNKLPLSYVFFSLTISPAAWSITPVSVEHDPAQGWHGEISLGLDRRSGNVDSEQYDIGALVRHRSNNRVLLLISDYQHAEVDNVDNADNASVHGRWIQMNLFRENWDGEVFAQLEQDDFRDLKRRSLAGAGVRWRHIGESESQAVSNMLGVGAFYEQEISDSEFEDESTWRGNIYYKGSIDRTKARYPLQVFVTTYLQPSLNESDNNRAIANAGAEFKIQEQLSITLAYQIGYDSDPFPGIEKKDEQTKIQLTYTLN